MNPGNLELGIVGPFHRWNYPKNGRQVKLFACRLDRFVEPDWICTDGG